MVHLEAHSYRSKAGFHLSGCPTCSQSMQPIVTCIDLHTSFSLNRITWWAQRSRVTFTQESIFGSKQLLHHHLMLPTGASGSISAWRSARLLLLFHQTSQVLRCFLTETPSFPRGGGLLLTSWFMSFILTVVCVPQETHGPSACTCSWCHQREELIKLRFFYRDNWTSWWSRRTFMAAKGNISQRELTQVGFWKTDEIFPTFTLQVVLKQSVLLMCLLGHNIYILQEFPVPSMFLISPSCQKCVPVISPCGTVSFVLEHFFWLNEV